MAALTPLTPSNANKTAMGRGKRLSPSESPMASSPSARRTPQQQQHGGGRYPQPPHNSPGSYDGNYYGLSPSSAMSMMMMATMQQQGGMTPSPSPFSPYAGGAMMSPAAMYYGYGPHHPSGWPFPTADPSTMLMNPSLMTMMMASMNPPHPHPQPSSSSVCVNLFPTHSPSRNGTTDGASTTTPTMMATTTVSERLDALRLSFEDSVVKAACSSFGRTALQQLLLQDGAGSFLLEEILGDLDTVALDANGCHVLKGLLESLPDSIVQGIVPLFKETLVLNMCTLSQHTRLPLLHLFERSNHGSLDVQHLVEILCANVQYLAATQQGVIALNRMFQLANPPQKGMIVTPVLPLLTTLATDPIGNYFVQCIVEHSGKVPAARYVSEAFAGHILELSSNKYASNVMEKIVRGVNVPVVRKRVQDELGLTHGTDVALLNTVLSDPYANFVVQALIDTATSTAEVKRLGDRIRPVLSASPYAIKIESRLKAKSTAVQGGTAQR